MSTGIFQLYQQLFIFRNQIRLILILNESGYFASQRQFKMNWQQAIKEYLDFLKLERSLAENSIKNYHFDLKKLENWLLQVESADKPLSISQETLQQFIYEMAKSLSARSQARLISGLKGFLDIFR